ncbi:hypothetical protein ACH4TU_06040 [Streptomyces physcomitrii]
MRENPYDNKDRLNRLAHSIRAYERDYGVDDFSLVVRGGLIEEHTGWPLVTGSGYPRKGE